MSAQFTYGSFYLAISGTLKAASPFHIGTGERFSLASDAPVLRDVDGRPYIPGSSLKGVLRSHLSQEAGLLGCTPEIVDRLFGAAVLDGSDGKPIGRLTILDVRQADSEPASGVEIRDHVRIDDTWGAAAAGAKFDAEVVLPSEAHHFQFRAAYEGDSATDDELILVDAALRYLQSGEMRVGAKSGWGYGAIILERETLSCSAFDRSTPDGLAAFVRGRLNRSFPAAPFSFPPHRATVEPLSPYGYLDLQLLLRFEGPVLVKSELRPDWMHRNRLDPANEALSEDYPSADKYYRTGLAEADLVFLTRASDNRYYLPGSGVRGVLRSHALRICRSCFAAEDPALSLFGWAKEADGTGHKGLIDIEDGELADPESPVIYLDHVALDRITNAAVETKKFSTCGLASPVFRVGVHLRLQPDHQAQVALFGFLLRDMLKGRLWAGSGTARGFGYIAFASIETARISLPDVPTWHSWLPLQTPETVNGRKVFTLAPKRLEHPEWKWLWEAVLKHWPQPSAPEAA